jgi:hypothetical protein
MLKRLAERESERPGQTLSSVGNQIFQLHPAEVAGLLHEAWNKRANAGPAEPAIHSQGVTDRSNAFYNALRAMTNGGKIGVVWEHLIYAYMIENTRI